MIQDTPALSELTAKSMDRTADARSTMLIKKFRNGGILVLTGANTSTGLRSMPVRYLGMDEVEVYPGDVDDEGHPVELAKERTSTFMHRRKIFMLSTPKVRGTSKIEAEFEATDKRYYFVPCLDCGEKFVIKWDLVQWDDRDPSTVRVVCPACGFWHREHHKMRMLRGGEWRATATSSSPLRVGYHLSGLYSPWKTWEERVAGFLAAGKDPGKLKPWVNSVLGETWVEKGDAPDWQRLYERREDYPLGTVPAGGLLLTAGADVQKDRIEVSIWAWGRGLESWLVDHLIIDGSPVEPATWAALAQLLAQVWPHASGAWLTITKLAIDSGGQYTTEVYAWTRRQSAAQVMAIKGVDGFDRTTPVAGPTNMEARQGAKRSRGGAKLWTIAVAVFKSELYRFLRQDRPTDEDLAAGAVYPAGYVHLPKGLDTERVKQLVAEQLVTVKTKRGFDRLEWQKLRARNETLDCRVYARAAAWVLGIDRFAEARWKQLEDQLTVTRSTQTTGQQDSPPPGRVAAGPSYRPVPPRRHVATSPWMTELALATADQIAAQIEKLEGLRANGYARVSYEGHTVEYRSLTEIDRAIATLRTSLANVRGSPSIRQIYVEQPDKGL